MGLADETGPDAVDEGEVGVVRMTLQRALHVNLRDSSGTELTAGAQYAEDAAHSSGDMLTMAGAVRRDTAAAGSGTDGDNSTLNVNNVGRLWTTAVIDTALPAGTNNIGDVDILSIAAGDNNIGNVDIVTMPDVTLNAETTKVIGTVNIAAAQTIATTNAGTFAVQAGQAAHDAAISGNPVRTAGRALSSDYTAVATGDTADFITDLNGKQIVMPYAIPENFVSGATAAITGTSDTSVIAAAGAGVRNYITNILVTNSHATVSTVVEIKDGTTVLYRGYALAAGGGFAVTLPVPLRGTANTAINAACITTASNVYVSCSGYKAP
jgi:hypothetical protein